MKNFSKTGIGESILRVEDRRFLTGAGQFVDDIAAPRALHCAFVRSPHAHALIRGIDRKRAEKRGAIVLTGADMAQDGIGAMRTLWRIRSADGAEMAEPPRWALARDRVRHVGEAVAAVVADTPAAATDGAETVAVDYEPLPAVTEWHTALAPGAPQLHAEAPGNIALRWTRGNAGAVRAGFESAVHRVKLALVNHRIAGAALEPRALLAVPDAAGPQLTLYAATQVPHHIRRLVAEQLDMTELALRVVAPDVGGGFGYKGKHYPEETTVAWLARRLRRPVRWTASRHESFLSDTQARDHATEAELALDAEGRFVALRVATRANLGAYVSTFGAAIPSAIYSALLAGLYRTPAILVEVTGVFTNTLPTDAYRGAGRPEACYVLERLADRAAHELALDRGEIRRRNLIPPEAMPYKTPIGPTYDSGDFPNVLKRALVLAQNRRSVPRGSRNGKLRGYGFACYLESSGVAPSRLAGALGARAGFFESASVRIDAGGGVTAFLGTHSHGQGHATSFAQILAQQLGVPLARIRIIEGDTAIVPYGTGTFGSRSIAVGGSALYRASEKIIAKGKRIAAHLFETAAGDVEFKGGVFKVVGTDRRLSFAEIARAAHVPVNYPHETLEPGLDESAFYDPPNFAFSNGVHVAHVEIDRETGRLAVLGYWAVDDVGRVINPMIVEGQIHGGVAQGIGQALLERCAYDHEQGQLLSASFLDYAMPRAADLPFITSICDESQPCTHNPLGAKGCGEAGAIAAPAAVVSAALDALAPLGIEDLEMPLTPERLWRAMRKKSPVLM